MNSLLSALSVVAILIGTISPAAAWTRRSVVAADIAKAELEMRARAQAIDRARAASQARLHQQALVHYRISRILRANALSAQARQFESMQQAARAQKNILGAILPAGDITKSAAFGPKYPKTVLHHFQGSIPPDELQRFAPAKSDEPAENKCAAEDHRDNANRNCHAGS